MAKYPGGVTVTGYVSPSDTTDLYATHKEEFGQGGYRAVTNVTERNLIGMDRRKLGMVVYVIGEDKEYKLLGGLENANWVYTPVTAYEIALANGFAGTKAQWLASLRGLDGKSAYQIAVANGFAGTEAQWVTSIKGIQGLAGKSTYEIAVEYGYTGTEEEWISKLQLIMSDGYLLDLINGEIMSDQEINSIINSKLGNYLPLSGGKMTGAITSVKETRNILTANNIDLATANVFVKTIVGATTFTLSNKAAAGSVNSFILELTNAGTNVTFWAGVKWAGGIQPTLTPAGTDILGFYSHDGGTTWRGILLSKDSK